MLAAAAHITAGFASPPHFSSVFHAMFGLAPSRLLAVPLAARSPPGNRSPGGSAT
ncbi:hypothetical protein ABT337_20580 [Saccharopolyspora hirsuta]|uniref:hypothetical protein n=1 Tax=Saccharopolyspora hirsuta TaxID=1837 RepID=UPI001BACA957|nr:hypothetical protein [Saccharopolyspora hirsuta]